MFCSKLSLSAAALALAQSAMALKAEKVSHAEVTLDLEATREIPVPGGVKTGFPVTEVIVTSETLFDATCSGYAWSSTYNETVEAVYTDLEVRLDCETADGVPFNVIETGSGEEMAIFRRIKYEIGAPYEHMRSEFYVAEVLTPPPALTLDVFKLTS